MITVPRIFVHLLEHLEIGLGDVITTIREATSKDRFRSDMPPPSGARMHQPSADPVRFPANMPYIAGMILPDTLRVTSISIDERLRWYCDTNQTAQLVLRKMGGRMPRTVLDAMAGMDVRDIVSHPVTDRAGIIVRKAHGNPATLHLAVDVQWMDAPLSAGRAG